MSEERTYGIYGITISFIESAVCANTTDKDMAAHIRELLAENAALKADVVQWQEIETAPIGMRFLAYCYPIENHRVVIAFKTKEGIVLDEFMEPLPWPLTHWMPLPKRISHG